MRVILIISLILLTLSCLLAGEYLGGRKNSPFKVRYQIFYPNGGTAVCSVILQGRFTEEMLRNTLQARHVNSQIRLLAVEQGNIVNILVKYQFRNKKSRGTWSNATAVLPNAITSRMAENQLQLRHPGYDIKIQTLSRKGK